MWRWKMVAESERRTLLECLAQVPDPRGRQGRRYQLYSILAGLILASLHGETSLRGMWIWMNEHFELLEEPLGFWDVGRIPVLEAIRTLLQELDEVAFLEMVNVWLGAWSETERISIDGKVLRGSKRGNKPALAVITAASQQMGLVLEQRGVGEDETGAALALLDALPLEGKLVTMDAGLLHRSVAERIVEKGGPIWVP